MLRGVDSFASNCILRPIGNQPGDSDDTRDDTTTSQRAARAPKLAECRAQLEAWRLQSSAAMKHSYLCAITLALAIAPLTATADGPTTGRWKMTINNDYPGRIWFAPGKSGMVCGLYLQDDGSKGMVTLPGSGTKVDGTWEESSGKGKVSFEFTGKSFKGGYTEDMTGTSTSPWVGTYDGNTSVQLTGKLDVDWGGGMEKTTITFTQKGNKVEGKSVYRYSGTGSGTLSGTLYGELLMATWKDKGDDGKPREGYFIAVVKLDAVTRKWDHLDGWYTSDLTSCSGGGLIQGSRKR
jgi:hypothetical protein